jgi:pimeloyl-ACP methyl ester carboxylesterase
MPTFRDLPFLPSVTKMRCFTHFAKRVEHRRYPAASSSASSFRSTSIPLRASRLAMVSCTSRYNGDRFHVIGITRRGFGRSSQPAQGYDIATRARDDIKVLDSLNIREAVFVGHSIAGTELSKLAVVYPDRVKKLVYLDSLDYGWGGYTQLPQPGLPEPTPTDLESLEHYAAFTVRVFGVRRPMAGLSPQIRTDSAGRVVDATTPPEISKKLWDGLEQAEYERIKAKALGIFFAETPRNRYPFYADLDRAKQEECDRINKPIVEWKAAARQRFRYGVKNSRVIELQDSDHYIYIKDEAPVVREMRRFLLKE